MTLLCAQSPTIFGRKKVGATRQKRTPFGSRNIEHMDGKSSAVFIAGPHLLQYAAGATGGRLRRVRLSNDDKRIRMGGEDEASTLLLLHPRPFLQTRNRKKKRTTIDGDDDRIEQSRPRRFLLLCRAHMRAYVQREMSGQRGVIAEAVGRTIANQTTGTRPSSVVHCILPSTRRSFTHHHYRSLSSSAYS